MTSVLFFCRLFLVDDSCFLHILSDSRSAFGSGQNQEALQFLLVVPVMFCNQELRFFSRGLGDKECFIFFFQIQLFQVPVPTLNYDKDGVFVKVAVLYTCHLYATMH